MWLDVCGLALGWCRAHTWQRGSEGRESVGGEGERLTGYSALSKQLVKNENTQFCQGRAVTPSATRSTRQRQGSSGWRGSAEHHHPTGCEKTGWSTLQTPQEPILLPWLCFEVHLLPNPNSGEWERERTMQPKYGPSALSIHTMCPPLSGIIVDISAVMSASGMDHISGTTAMASRHAVPPPALMLQKRHTRHTRHALSQTFATGTCHRDEGDVRLLKSEWAAARAEVGDSHQLRHPK
jgi:hypothetical protein